MNDFTEQNCTFEHEGYSYTACGAYRCNHLALVYISGNKATDWHGNLLGSVKIVNIYRNNLTGTPITAVRVTMLDGTKWHGRYGSDWSQACRVRRAKGE